MEAENRPKPFTLPIGTVLKSRYRVIDILGTGGFGITYKVIDTYTDKVFAMKEYAPVQMAVRAGDQRGIRPLNESKITALEHGRIRFLEEADLLRQLDYITGMIPVMDCFNENNTSYFVMEYLEGVTLNTYLKQHDGRLGLGETMSIIGNVAYALDRVHDKAGVFHRDVTPDNIFIMKDHSVRIIDFGNAKYLLRKENETYSIVLKPGFAPPEQYLNHAHQGIYTDVYSLAATMYYCLTGMMIPSAPDRLHGEQYIPLKVIFPDIKQSFSDALDQALCLDYNKRTPNMAEFMKHLGVDPTLYEDKRQITPYLELITGAFAGRRWKLQKDTCITIGRRKTSDIVFKDDLYISKKHCEIYFDSEVEVFYLEDYSTNGTYIDDRRLPQKQLTKIYSGQQFAIGDKSTVLKVGVVHG